jgi:hypothetical protein
MTKFFKIIFSVLLLLALVACGGGGGKSGTTGAGGSTSTATSTSTVALAGGTTVSNGTITVAFIDAGGVAVPGRALSQTQAQYIKVVVKDKVGDLVQLAKTVLSVDTKLVTVSPAGGLLTDSSGVGLFKISPASVTASGVVTVGVSATVNGIDLTQTIDLVISPGTVTLSGLAVTPQTVQRGQSVNATVAVLVNGTPASSNSVSVEFSSACGKATPSSALVDSTGKATTVVQTTLQGVCTVNASTSGSTMSATYTVTAPPVAGIQFVSTTPSTIYQKGSTGLNTSIVSFKIVDSIAGPVQGLDVKANLTNLDGGINFCDSPQFLNANGQPEVLAVSGADGIVNFSVCAGTLPATVQVRAGLLKTPSIFTTSNILTIQTGLPTQRFFSLSATKLSLLAGAGFTSLNTNPLGPLTRSADVNGEQTELSVFAADRQGNPVPNGTPITLVAEGGQINTGSLSSCIIKDGSCKVTFIGQDYRPWGSTTQGGEVRPGRVTILAYADGEESFIDSNNNNRYDPGELFEDLGVPYLDKDENRFFDIAYKNRYIGTDDGEFQYPIPIDPSNSQKLACPITSDIGLSVQNTCNGVWTQFSKVRKSIVVVFGGANIGHPDGYDASIPAEYRTAILSDFLPQPVVRIADYNGNSLPTGTAVSVEVVKLNPSSECSATLKNGELIASSTEPTIRYADLEKCIPGDVVVFIAAVPGINGKTVSEIRVKMR